MGSVDASVLKGFVRLFSGDQVFDRIDRLFESALLLQRGRDARGALSIANTAQQKGELALECGGRGPAPWEAPRDAEIAHAQCGVRLVKAPGDEELWQPGREQRDGGSDPAVVNASKAPGSDLTQRGERKHTRAGARFE